MEEIKEGKATGVEFDELFMLCLLGKFLAPTASHSVARKLLKVVLCTKENVKSFDWTAYVAKKLQMAVSNYVKAYRENKEACPFVGGCLYFLLVCTLFILSCIEYCEMRVISYFMLASQVLFGEEFRLEKDKIAIDNAVVYWTDDKVQEMVSLEKDSNIGFLFGETSNGGKEKEKEKEVPKRDDETNQNAVAYLNPVSFCTC